MKHKLVNKLKAENKRLRREMKNIKHPKNDCPMCSGVSDETRKRMQEQLTDKCH